MPIRTTKLPNFTLPDSMVVIPASFHAQVAADDLSEKRSTTQYLDSRPWVDGSRDNRNQTPLNRTLWAFDD
jgi:hypothetical protein